MYMDTNLFLLLSFGDEIVSKNVPYTCMQFMKSTAVSYNMIGVYVAIFTVTPHIHYVLHSEPKPLVFSLCIALSSLALLHYLTGIGTIQYDRVQPQNVKESTHRKDNKMKGGIMLVKA